jgi:hypothetical protein
MASAIGNRAMLALLREEESPETAPPGQLFDYAAPPAANEIDPPPPELTNPAGLCPAGGIRAAFPVEALRDRSEGVPGINLFGGGAF